MTTRTMLFSLIVCAFPILTKAQPAQTPAQQEVYQAIVLIGKAWTQNNLDILEKYLHKDYVHTDVRGQLLNRTEWLNYVKDRRDKGVTNPDIEFKDVHISIYQDIALVTGINIFTGQAYTTNDNNKKPRQLRFTQVLKKQGDVWQRLMFQATYIENM